MVVIRLSRGGAKKRPFYHIVATDKRKRRDGGSLERLGYFNPLARGKDLRLSVNAERIEYWRSVGAQLSERVASLLKQLAKDPEAATKPKPVKKIVPKKPAVIPADIEAKAEEAPAAAPEEVEAPAEENPAEDTKSDE